MRVPFPNRDIVERAIDRSNMTGMSLNDGNERVILPIGTLQIMLRMIDEKQAAHFRQITENDAIQMAKEKIGNSSSVNFVAAPLVEQAKVKIKITMPSKSFLDIDTVMSVEDMQKIVAIAMKEDKP